MASKKSLRSPIFAIIINWNRPEDTIECIKSVSQQDIDLNILVIDNGSVDGSVKKILKIFSQIDIIENETNLGFAEGVNIGLRYALSKGAEYIFIINNDAIALPNSFSTLLSYAKSHIGLCAPLVYYAKRHKQIWSAGGNVNKWLLNHIDELHNKIDRNNWPEIIQREFVTGCCVLISAEIINKIGYFDSQNFFLYFEDLDYCYRLRKAGYHIIVVPKAKILHKISASSGGVDAPNEVYWKAKSGVIFYYKHGKKWQWVLLLIWRFASAIRTSIRFIKDNNTASLIAYWKGLTDAIKFIFKN